MSADPLEDGISLLGALSREGFSHSDCELYVTCIEIVGCIFLPAQVSNGHLLIQPYFYRETAAFAFLALISVS